MNENLNKVYEMAKKMARESQSLLIRAEIERAVKSELGMNPEDTAVADEIWYGIIEGSK